MLGEHYANLLAKLIDRAAWSITLPETHRNFFEERGQAMSIASEQRNAGRTRVRTRGIMIYESCLPAIPRPRRCIGIYTGDFSHNGIGFLAPHQLFPTESVRILFPMFWMQVQVVRARRLGPRCFEIGGTLIRRCDPSQDAFDPLLSTEAPPARTTSGANA